METAKINADLLAACETALVLLEGVADEEDRNGKRNAALNVRQCERRLRAAVDAARPPVTDPADSPDDGPGLARAESGWHQARRAERFQSGASYVEG